MRECQCGYVVESDEFEYCPKCGKKVTDDEPECEYITPNNLTVSRFKKIIERSEEPIRLRTLMAVNKELKETSIENAVGFFVYGIDPEDEVPFWLGGPGTVVIVAPNRSEEGAFGFEETWMVVELFASIAVKPPGFLDDFSWFEAVNNLNESNSFAIFKYVQEQSSIYCQYNFPLFVETTEEEVQKMMQAVFFDIMMALDPLRERIDTEH